MICEGKNGFLTLGTCGTPAASSCSHCGRSMCPAHLSPATGFSKCYDCAAAQPAEETKEHPEETEYDDNWARGYRSSYYSDTGYRPSHRSSYDSTDRSSFDDRRADSFAEDHEPGGFDAS